jgi:cell division transport system permease protein
MIIFYLSEALKSFKRAKLAALITIFTMTIALLLISLSGALIYSSGKIENRIRSNQKVSLYLQPNAEGKEIKSVIQDLKKEDLVRRLDYVDKKEAKQKFVEQTGKDFSSILEVNPLPASIIISFHPDKFDQSKIETLLKKYSEKAVVDEVVFDYDFLTQLMKYINSSKYIVYAIALFLTMIGIYLTFSTTRLVINSRQKYYETMKLVGAKLSAIKLPIVLFSIIIGFISAVLSLIIINFGIFLLNKYIASFNFEFIIYWANIGIIVFGSILGILSSIFSTNTISLKIKS